MTTNEVNVDIFADSDVLSTPTARGRDIAPTDHSVKVLAVWRQPSNK